MIGAVRSQAKEQLGQIENALPKSISKLKTSLPLSNMVLIRNSNFYDKLTGFQFSMV